MGGGVSEDPQKPVFLGHLSIAGASQLLGASPVSPGGVPSPVPGAGTRPDGGKFSPNPA